MRTPSVAFVLVVCTMALASCGDDDDSDDASGGGGGADTAEEGGGGISGGGGGEDSGGGEDGAGQEAGGGSGATTLRLAADPGGDLAFDKDSLSAKPGPVVIAFDNQSSVPHAVEVEGNDVEEETETITGSSARLRVDLEPGEYKFYCPVGNHEQAGMVGTLTVR